MGLMIERTKLISTSAKSKGKVDIDYVFVVPKKVSNDEDDGNLK